MSLANSAETTLHESLHYCAMNGDIVKCMEIIEKCPSNLFLVDKNGRTPLDCARIGNKDDVTWMMQREIRQFITRQRLLSAKPSNINQLAEHNSKLKASILTSIAKNDCSIFMSCLKEFGVSRSELASNFPDEDFFGDLIMLAGFSVVQWASCFLLPLEEHSEVISKLVRLGCDLSHENQFGHTALTWSCLTGSETGAECLLAADANITQITKLDGKNCFHYAFVCCNAKIIDLLFRRLYAHVQAKVSRKYTISTRASGKHILDMRNDIYSVVALADCRLRTPIDMISHCTSNSEACRAIYDSYLLRVDEWASALELSRVSEDGIRCWNGCGIIGKMSFIMIHSSEDCPKRLIACQLCSSTIYYGELRDHLAYHCSSRKVACPNSVNGCRWIMPFGKLSVHLSHECDWHECECRLNCGANVFRCVLYEHEVSKCPKRIVQCRKCDMEFLAEEIGKHDDEICPFRVVLCSYYCGKSFEFRNKSKHESEECIIPCRWKCGQKLGPENLRLAHESHFCLKREIPCRNSCGQVIPLDCMESHMQSVCNMALVSCPNGCSKLILNQDILTHSNEWQGDCTQRLVRCPRNLSRMRIRVDKSIGEILRWQPMSENNKSLFLYLVRFDEGHRLVDLETESFCAIGLKDGQPSNQPWKCNWITRFNSETHLKCECYQRDVLIGKQAIPLHNLEFFEEAKIDSSSDNSVSRVRVTCDICLEDLGEAPQSEASTKLRNHHEICPLVLTRCQFGCGCTTQRKSMNYHETCKCPKRNVVCERCECKVWAEELSDHVINSCPFRNVLCTRNCGETVEFRNLADHVDNQCKLRKVSCECGEEVIFEDLHLHVQITCSSKKVYCSLGCGTIVKRSEMEGHQKTSCQKKDVYLHQLVYCPLKCGTQVTRIAVIDHVSKECCKRIVECPYNCGEILRVTYISNHTCCCWNRAVPCEALVTKCEKPLCRWIIQENGEYHQVNCEHGGNPLLFAARTSDIGLMKFVLEKTAGADIDLEDARGNSAMTASCRCGNLESVKLLTEFHGDVDTETSSGKTPLIEAVKSNNLKLVEHLINCGCSVSHLTRQGMSAIKWANKLKFYAIADHVNVCIQAEGSVRTVFCLIASNNIEVLHKLLQAGEPFQPTGTTVLQQQFLEHGEALRECNNALEELKHDQLENETNIRQCRIQMRDLAERGHELVESSDAADAKTEKVKLSDKQELSRMLNNLECCDVEEALQHLDNNLVIHAITGLGLVLGHDMQASRGFDNVVSFIRMLNRVHGGHHNLAYKLKSTSYDSISNESIDTIKNCSEVIDTNISSDEDSEFAFVRIIHALLRRVVHYFDFEKFQNEQEEKRHGDAVKTIITLRNTESDNDERLIFLLSRREMLKVMVEQKTKESKALASRERLWHNKVKVARIMNSISPSGHTVMSFACSYGDIKTIDFLFAHGGTCGFTEEICNLSATLIILYFRRYKLREGKGARALGQNGQLAQIISMTAKIEELTGNIVLLRSHHRLPVPEAAYMGHLHVIQRILARKRFNFSCSRTWTFPAPHLPYLFSTKSCDAMSIYDCVLQGMNDISRDTYDPDLHGGWVSCGSDGDLFEKTRDLCRRILLRHEFDVGKIKERLERRKITSEKSQDLASLEKQMREAISSNDFKQMVAVIRMGVSPDCQTRQGTTALIAAAAEDVNANNHEWMVDEENNQILAIEFLLHQPYGRPTIDFMNDFGVCALSYGASLSNLLPIQALLECGASVNLTNNQGVTPLMFAVSGGSAKAALMLLERNADYTVLNAAGMTALQMAESCGLEEVTATILRYMEGVHSYAPVKRGTAMTEVSCLMGCGQLVVIEDLEHHASICSMRFVSCPNSCGEIKLFAKEVDDHVASSCIHRKVTCVDCSIVVPFSNLAHHLNHECCERLEPCPDGCGESVKVSHLDFHTPFCCKRKVGCDLGCGLKICYDAKKYHESSLCGFRIIKCPNGCNVSFQAMHLNFHFKQVCIMMTQACNWCKREFERHEIVDHESSCEEKISPCPNNCHEMVRAADLTTHLDTACGLRCYHCLQGCGDLVQHMYYEEHISTYCGESFIICKCCGDRMKRRFVKIHEKYECVLRLVKCSQCLQFVTEIELENHKRVLCESRISKCTNPKCFKMLPLSEIRNHLANECKWRLIICPNGCGKWVESKALKVHVEDKCLMRRVICPLGCESRIVAHNLDIHVKRECPMISRFHSESATG